MQVCTLRQTDTMPAPHQSVFTGRMPFLPPNQQRQSTDGCYANSIIAKNAKKITPDYFTTFIPPVIMIIDLSPLN